MAKNYQNMQLNVLNNFCKKGTAKIWLQTVQEVKGQIAIDSCYTSTRSQLATQG